MVEIRRYQWGNQEMPMRKPEDTNGGNQKIPMRIIYKTKGQTDKQRLQNITQKTKARAS
jgi:hypothetical protein